MTVSSNTLCPNIVALVARKRCGKDTLADVLGREYGAHKLSFSDGVRAITSDLFPWVPSEVPDSIKDSVVDHPANVRGLTYRQVWRTVDHLRENVDPHLFINWFRDNQLQMAVKNPSLCFVIARVSTAEEFALLKSLGIKTVRIIRKDMTGVDLDPFEDYLSAAPVDHEFVFDINDGAEPFLEFFREEVLWKANQVWQQRSALTKSLGI